MPKKRIPIFCDDVTAKRLYEIPEVKKVILIDSRRYAKNRPELRDDIIQAAWIRVMDTTKTTEALGDILDRARKGGYNEYKSEYRERIKNDDIAFALWDDSGKGRQVKPKFRSDEIEYGSDAPWADYTEADKKRFDRSMKKFKKFHKKG